MPEAVVLLLDLLMCLVLQTESQFLWQLDRSISFRHLHLVVQLRPFVFEHRWEPQLYTQQSWQGLQYCPCKSWQTKNRLKTNPLRISSSHRSWIWGCINLVKLYFTFTNKSEGIIYMEYHGGKFFEFESYIDTLLFVLKLFGLLTEFILGTGWLEKLV